MILLILSNFLLKMRIHSYYCRILIFAFYVSFLIRLDAGGQRRRLYETDFPAISALVGLLGIDVPLDPHEVVDQVAELAALGVLVEHVNRADTLVLAEIDLAMGKRLLAYMQTLPYLLVQLTALSSLLPTRAMPRGVITMVGSTGVR